MYKTRFQQCKALRFRRFSRKGYALFACLGRVVTIGVLTVATLRSAAVTSTAMSVTGGTTLRDMKANYWLSGWVVGGDSINDMPLLLESDVSYTFPYAPKEVQEAATYVVPTIVDALEHSMKDPV